MQYDELGGHLVQARAQKQGLLADFTQIETQIRNLRCLKTEFEHRFEQEERNHENQAQQLEKMNQRRDELEDRLRSRTEEAASLELEMEETK